MPSRARRSSQTDRASRDMEWKVELPVPAFGLGEVFQAMHQWAALKGEYRRDWYQWSFPGGLGPDGLPIPHVCFAFRDGNVAHEFAARWQQQGAVLRTNGR